MNSFLGGTVSAHSPLLRGMISYAVIWPACSIAQEYLEHGTTLANADWARATRFGIFGSIFMAPVWHNWIKYTNKFFKQRNLSTALKRSLIEQLSYSPVATAYFYLGMTALERKPFDACVQEVREKFWPTYRIGLLYWPIVQTINFYFISKKNRLVFLSVASFIWMMFMAHMKDEKGRGFDKISFFPTESGNVNKDLITSTGNDMNEDTTQNEITPSEKKRSSLIPVIQAVQGQETSKSSTTKITYLVVGTEETTAEKDYKTNLEKKLDQETSEINKSTNSDGILLTTNTHGMNITENTQIDLTEEPRCLGAERAVHDDKLSPDIDDIILITPSMVINEDNKSSSPKIGGNLSIIAALDIFDDKNSNYPNDLSEDNLSEISNKKKAISESKHSKEETQTSPADKQIRVVTFVDEIEDISTLISDRHTPETSSEKTTALDEEKHTQEEDEKEKVILQKPLEDLFGAIVDISCSDNLPRSAVKMNNQNTVSIKALDMVNVQSSVQDESYEQTELNESLG